MRWPLRVARRVEDRDVERDADVFAAVVAHLGPEFVLIGAVNSRAVAARDDQRG